MQKTDTISFPISYRQLNMIRHGLGKCERMFKNQYPGASTDKRRYLDEVVKFIQSMSVRCDNTLTQWHELTNEPPPDIPESFA